MSLAPIYFIHDFTEERSPCAPTLDGWAAWLAEPADQEDFPDRGEIANGATFKASVMQRLDDVTATLGEDGWTYSRQVESDATFFAEPCGRSWDAENSSDDLADYLELQIDFGLVSVGDSIDIVVCATPPDVMIRFDRAGPTCVVIGLAQ